MLRPRMKKTLSCIFALAFCASAAAAPGAEGASRNGDSLLQMLQERGLAAAQPVVKQMREGAADLVISAMNFIGLPYRRGGNSEQGFDCSGFTRHIFEMSLGLALPRRSDEQAASPALQPVAKDDIQPGDLVFFNTMRQAFSHVGIYVGDGKFIHSPRTGGAVRIEDMRISYWAQRYNGARRALADAVGGGSAVAAPATAAASVNVPAADKATTTLLP